MWGYQLSNTTNSKHIRYYIKFCITKKITAMKIYCLQINKTHNEGYLLIAYKIGSKGFRF